MSVPSYDSKQIAATLAACEVCAKPYYFTSARTICCTCVRWAANILLNGKGLVQPQEQGE